MGTYMTDSLEFDLFTGADLSTDATDTGDVVQVDWPQLVSWYLDTGTVTGANTIDIQGCETSDFTTADVRTYTTIPVAATDDDAILEGTFYADSKFLRASVTIGTGGDMAGSVLKLRQPHYLRTKTTSSKALA